MLVSIYHGLVQLIFEKKYLQQSCVHRNLTSFLKCPLIPLVLSARVKKTRLTLTSTVRYTSYKPR